MVTDLVVFVRNAVLMTEHALGALEIDDDVAFFVAGDRSVQDFPDALSIFFTYLRFLCLAQALHDALFGGLGGDSAEIAGGHFPVDHITDIDIGHFPLYLGDGYLFVGIDDAFDDFQFGYGIDIPGFGIECDAQAVGRPDGTAGSRNERFFDGLSDNVSIQATVPLKVIKHRHKFVIHNDLTSYKIKKRDKPTFADFTIRPLKTTACQRLPTNSAVAKPVSRHECCKTGCNR